MAVTKTVRGKRPKIYEQQGLDHLMAITTALVQEVAVLRDRIDLVERVAESKGVIIQDEIENFTLLVGFTRFLNKRPLNLQPKTPRTNIKMS